MLGAAVELLCLVYLFVGSYVSGVAAGVYKGDKLPFKEHMMCIIAWPYVLFIGWATQCK